MAALAALWAIASFWFPFGWDQGFFAAVGDVILRGGMPYRDAWEIKGPLPQYAFAMAQWLFGRHMWSIRVLDLPVLIAGAAALGSIVARRASPARGWWAAIVFTLWIGSLTWFHTVQPDTWASILVTFAALPLVARKPEPGQLMLSGLMVGLSALVKPLYLAFLALPLAHIADQRWAQGEGGNWRRAAAVIGMGLIPPSLAAAWFAGQGALGALVDVHLLYAVRVYSADGSPGIVAAGKNVLKFFAGSAVVWALPAIAVGVYALWRRSHSAFFVITTWLAVALACVAAQRKFYKYHWVLAFPPLTALGAIGFDRALGAFSSGRSLGRAAPARVVSGSPAPRIGAAVILLLGAVAVGKLAEEPLLGVSRWLSFMTGRVSGDQYYAFHRAGAFVAGDEIRAADYIRKGTVPQDGVAVFGNDAEINFLSGRANPTRFLYALPLTEGGRSTIKAAYRREYMLGLHRNLPAYLVVGVPWGNLSKTAALQDFPELEDLLEREYFLETRIGALDLYRRRGDG
jgi:hypothetical protein